MLIGAIALFLIAFALWGLICTLEFHASQSMSWTEEEEATSEYCLRPVESRTSEYPSEERFEEDFRFWKQIGVRRLAIVNRWEEEPCAECKEMLGAVFTVDEMIRQQPLPHRRCTCDECLCTYQPLVGEKVK